MLESLYFTPRPARAPRLRGIAPGLARRIGAYYRDPCVRRRLEEFLGTQRGEAAGARFVSCPGPLGDAPGARRPVEELWSAIEANPEVARSLWDRRLLVVDLDLEHVHFDRPWQTFLHPERAFALQRPVTAAVEEVLHRCGIEPLHLLSGRGHHYVWAVGLQSRAFAGLDQLARELGLERVPALPPVAPAPSPELAAAHLALGLVMEWVGQRAVLAAAPRCSVPVQLTAVAVGGGPEGREIVSIDLSTYGDPLEVRTVRLPFSVYLKGWRLGRELPEALARRLGALVAVPLAPGRALRQGLADRAELGRAAALARHSSVAIPRQDRGTEALLERYRGSPLAAIHRWFYSEEPDPEERWPSGYDRLALQDLPPCARCILAEPNDRILVPVGIQHLTRLLLAEGWHPRHVAGLVRSKLQRDHAWMPGIHFDDPAVRADFYVRLFTGVCFAGVDRLVDFNCRSAQEKGLCPGGACGWSLEPWRDRLARRCGDV